MLMGNGESANSEARLFFVLPVSLVQWASWVLSVYIPKGTLGKGQMPKIQQIESPLSKVCGCEFGREIYKSIKSV